MITEWYVSDQEIQQTEWSPWSRCVECVGDDISVLITCYLLFTLIVTLSTAWFCFLFLSSHNISIFYLPVLKCLNVILMQMRPDSVPRRHWVGLCNNSYVYKHWDLRGSDMRFPPASLHPLFLSSSTMTSSWWKVFHASVGKQCFMVVMVVFVNSVFMVVIVNSFSW